ncbi:unnamed protein product [Rangifer tarandus platyrhynchus]|uniref:Uncharacterized protein n=1 Tax=Rangifer tarandus platyrhynchus TaxID=3082113 RepID=A0ACB1KHH3_RANTA
MVNNWPNRLGRPCTRNDLGRRGRPLPSGVCACVLVCVRVCVCVCLCTRTSSGNGHVYVFSSVPRSCPTLCDPMDCSLPGLPAHHQLPELAQTPVHRVGDATQPSPPLSSPSPPALNLSQHRGLFR